MRKLLWLHGNPLIVRNTSHTTCRSKLTEVHERCWSIKDPGVMVRRGGLRADSSTLLEVISETIMGVNKIRIYNTDPHSIARQQ